MHLNGYAAITGQNPIVRNDFEVALGDHYNKDFKDDVFTGWDPFF